MWISFHLFHSQVKSVIILHTFYIESITLISKVSTTTWSINLFSYFQYIAVNHLVLGTVRGLLGIELTMSINYILTFLIFHFCTFLTTLCNLYFLHNNIVCTTISKLPTEPLQPYPFLRSNVSWPLRWISLLLKGICFPSLTIFNNKTPLQSVCIETYRIYCFYFKLHVLLPYPWPVLKLNPQHPANSN